MWILIIDVDIGNRPLPFCAKWASADVVFIVVDVDLVFVDNAFSIKRIFMYNLIIDVDIVSRALPFSAEWASADVVVVLMLMLTLKQYLGLI